MLELLLQLPWKILEEFVIFCQMLLLQNKFLVLFLSLGTSDLANEANFEERTGGHTRATTCYREEIALSYGLAGFLRD